MEHKSVLSHILYDIRWLGNAQLHVSPCKGTTNRLHTILRAPKQQRWMQRPAKLKRFRTTNWNHPDSCACSRWQHAMQAVATQQQCRTVRDRTLQATAGRLLAAAAAKAKTTLPAWAGLA
jgi:hypothetical protein